MADEIKIRAATPDDASALLKIYAPYVKNTSITYEYDVPSEEEFRRRIESTLRRYPYLVLEREGDILGYAYAGPLHSRPAYDWAVEIAYPEVEDEYLTKNSAEFHAHLGYRMVGGFTKCGYKFHRWYGMVWMEKLIGEHLENQPPVIPFPQIRDAIREKYGIE